MSQFDLTADVLKRNLDMFVATIGDFSDADIYVRPCPGANSPAWQLGHLIGRRNVDDRHGRSECHAETARRFRQEILQRDL